MHPILELTASAPVVLGYLDPGTGSLAFQLLLAGLLSGAYYFRAWSGAALKLLSRSPRHG